MYPIRLLALLRAEADAGCFSQVGYGVCKGRLPVLMGEPVSGTYKSGSFLKKDGLSPEALSEPGKALGII